MSVTKSILWQLVLFVTSKTKFASSLEVLIWLPTNCCKSATALNIQTRVLVSYSIKFTRVVTSPLIWICWFGPSWFYKTPAVTRAHGYVLKEYSSIFHKLIFLLNMSFIIKVFPKAFCSWKKFLIGRIVHFAYVPECFLLLTVWSKEVFTSWWQSFLGKRSKGLLTFLFCIYEVIMNSGWRNIPLGYVNKLVIFTGKWVDISLQSICCPQDTTLTLLQMTYIFITPDVNIICSCPEMACS